MVLCPILALIVNIIIIEKQVSIKSMTYPKHPEGLCPRGAALIVYLCQIRWAGEPSPVPFTPDIRYKNTSVGLRGKAQRTHVQQALPHSRVELFRSMEDLCHHQRIA